MYRREMRVATEFCSNNDAAPAHYQKFPEPSRDLGTRFDPANVALSILEQTNGTVCICMHSSSRFVTATPS